MDLFNDANDNMVILLPRYGKKHIIYKDILIKMILCDCIVVVSDYLFFLFVEHTSNGLEDFKVIFMLLIEIFHLQMISYLFSFWKDSIIGYIVAFIVFFIPVMVCGFYFSMGTNGNQYDMELFFKLNPTLEALEIKLNAGEETSFVIPYTMNEQQVSKKDWNRVDKMKLYMVLQYYPQKIGCAVTN